MGCCRLANGWGCRQAQTLRSCPPDCTLATLQSCCAAPASAAPLRVCCCQGAEAAGRHRALQDVHAASACADCQHLPVLRVCPDQLCGLVVRCRQLQQQHTQQVGCSVVKQQMQGGHTIRRRQLTCSVCRRLQPPCRAAQTWMAPVLDAVAMTSPPGAWQASRTVPCAAASRSCSWRRKPAAAAAAAVSSSFGGMPMSASLTTSPPCGVILLPFGGRS